MSTCGGVWEVRVEQRASQIEPIGRRWEVVRGRSGRGLGFRRSWPRTHRGECRSAYEVTRPRSELGKVLKALEAHLCHAVVAGIVASQPPSAEGKWWKREELTWR